MTAVFSLERTAEPADIDELGHVSNLVYLRWVQEVAIAHSTAKGWTGERYRESGAGWVVRKHEITYRRPVLEGDQLAIDTWVESFGGASSVRRTSIRRITDDVEVASAATTWAFVSFETGAPQRIPAAVRDAFEVSSAPSP